MNFSWEAGQYTAGHTGAGARDAEDKPENFFKPENIERPVSHF